MSSKNSNYIPRIVDKELGDLMEFFGAVSIEGCKWCGKSTTAEQMAKSVFKIHAPENADLVRIATSQPSIILDGERPRLIDEWQDLPSIWDAVRIRVDESRESGQYILTGSSTPRKNHPKHSGAGRIARIVMHPMSLYESGDSNGSVSLRNLFEQPSEISGESDFMLEQLAYLSVRGGWPESVVKRPKNPYIIAREYLEVITNREDSFQDLDYYSPGRMRALLRGLARGISAPSKISTLIGDIASNTGTTLSDVTAMNYISILEQIYIIDDIEAWCPLLRSKTQIRNSKKRNLADPSLAAAALSATEADLIQDIHTFGLIYESMIMRDLKIYAELYDGNIYYYRDKNGTECDAVVHLQNGEWGAMEIKLGNDIETLDVAATNLIKFANTVDTEKMHEPRFLAIISGTAKRAYRREDGIYVVPAGCLGP